MTKSNKIVPILGDVPLKEDKSQTQCQPTHDFNYMLPFMPHPTQIRLSCQVIMTRCQNPATGNSILPVQVSWHSAETIYLQIWYPIMIWAIFCYIITLWQQWQFRTWLPHLSKFLHPTSPPHAPLPAHIPSHIRQLMSRLSTGIPLAQD